MPRALRIFLIVCLAAFCAAFIVQTVFRFLGAQRSLWGGNPGWQREIAFWNVGAALIVFMTLRLSQHAAAYAVAAGCTLLFFLLAANHLAAFVQAPQAQFHWPPLLLNTFGCAFGARVLLRCRRDSAVEASSRPSKAT